jgi:hypothetical protein
MTEDRGRRRKPIKQSGVMAVEMRGGLGEGDKVQDIGVKHRGGIRDRSRKS